MIVAGGVLLTFVCGEYALGAVKADAARAAWNAKQAADAMASARAFAVPRTPRERPVEGAPVARIVIPRINLDAIVLEGVGDAELNADPGHFPGSALPGESGNAVISAHRDRHFSHFDQLALGDTVVTESAGRTTRWVIAEKRIIDKDAPALFNTSTPTLTLTTCWPIRYFGSAPDRLILTAKPLPTA
jgi:sortase A